MTSTSSRSVRLTGPETGRGQASLWTAAAAPDHKLWTTLRGPVDPSRLPSCPLPLRRGRPPTTHQSHQSKERRLTPILSRRAGTGEHRQALTGGPYLSIEVGHTGLSKAREIGTWVTEHADLYPKPREHRARSISDKLRSKQAT